MAASPLENPSKNLNFPNPQPEKNTEENTEACCVRQPALTCRTKPIGHPPRPAVGRTKSAGALPNRREL